MLLELSIRDFAIIDRLRLAFGPGFNALTGETGAGKSIIIDALSAILGERTGAEFVRAGAPSARVEGVFDLGAHGAEMRVLLAEFGLLDDVDGSGEGADEPLILSREIAAGGRSVARVNGRTVTAATLARVGERLVDIHGQSDHLSLLRPAGHVDLLDRYAGILPAREALSAVVAELRGVRERLASLDRDERELARRVELLRYQVEEIGEARLRSGEEDELDAERRVLGSAERLTELATIAYRKLSGGAGDDFSGKAPRAALDLLRQVSVALDELARLDPSLEEVRAGVEEQVYLLEDAAATLRDYRERVEADPARLAEIEDRLTLLKDLKRKYGATVEEVIAFGEAAEAELAGIERREERAEELRAREEELLRRIGKESAVLTVARRAAGERLAAAVEASIAELNMGRARFAVRIEHHDDPAGAPVRDRETGEERRLAFDARGGDRVEFLIAANVGEPLKPLARVASGGETARLMLALKSILSQVDTTPTLVFDEVDVGVGGRSGQVVGEKLWGLTAGATEHQVLCISHLPQIAAFADSHFRISKRQVDDRTVSSVEPIADEARVDEIAVMLDGTPVTEASRANARAMLERVAAWKASRRTDTACADGATDAPTVEMGPATGNGAAQTALPGTSADALPEPAPAPRRRAKAAAQA